MLRGRYRAIAVVHTFLLLGKSAPAEEATGTPMKTFIGECRRRQVFQVAALYVVGTWVVLQVTALAFDNWGIPTEAMRFIWIGSVAGLPIALVLGWRYDIAGGRIVRTGDSDNDADRILRRSDYLVLGIAAMAALAITGGLIAGIMQARTPLPGGAEAAAINPKSIAVLPFEDMSPDRDQAHFSNGIAEEILHWLAAFRDLKVSSRTSVSILVDAGFTVTDIGAELGVAYVLEGSVRKAGDTLRITAQLIEARTDAHVWSETYEYRPDDIFAVYDQVSAQIGRELKVTLRDAAPVAYATDSATYELYLEGRRLIAERGPGDLSRAIELFERVVTLDPSFAPGHTGLAESYFWRVPPVADRLDRIQAAVERALELDAENPEALAILGRNHLDRGNTAEGRALLKRAIHTNPNNALAYRWLGQSFMSSDPARYIALAQQAYRRDPLETSIHWHQATSLRLMGRTDDALAVIRNRLRFYPDDNLAYPLAADVHLSAGNLDLALKSLYLAYRRHPDVSNYNGILDILGFLEEQDLAVDWMHELQRRFDSVGISQAISEAQRGNTEKALQMMRERVERGENTELGLAFFMLRTTDDPERTRPILEKGFERAGKDPMQFDPVMLWALYIDYALILHRAGETEAADELIRDIKAHVVRQIDEGVKINIFMDHTQYLYAKLLGITGETEEAVAQLRDAVLRDGYPCIQCLGFAHFDSIRDDPGFIAVRDELQARLAAQRQQLADERMLVTPEEVMALENFDIDPFKR